MNVRSETQPLTTAFEIRRRRPSPVTQAGATPHPCLIVVPPGSDPLPPAGGPQRIVIRSIAERNGTACNPVGTLRRVHRAAALLLVLAALLLAGCGSSGDDTASAPPPVDTTQSPPAAQEDDEGVRGGGEIAGAEIGEKVPDIAGTTLDGNQLALSDLRGKKVIVNLWSSW